METENKSFEDIATQCGLTGKTKIRYVAYMTSRWKDEEGTQCVTGYALEWARRFAAEVEYEWSDLEGQAILREIDGK